MNTSSALYKLCHFFDDCIPLDILKHKVWDLKKLNIQQHPFCDLALNALEHALIILSIVKWNTEFRRCPPRSSSSIRSFCGKCLSMICLLSPRLLKFSNIICTSQTQESFGTGGLKLNDPLKYFITDGCWGMCWYFILSTCATAHFTEVRTLWDTPSLKNSVKLHKILSNVLDKTNIFGMLTYVMMHWWCLAWLID